MKILINIDGKEEENYIEDDLLIGIKDQKGIRSVIYNINGYSICATKKTFVPGVNIPSSTNGKLIWIVSFKPLPLDLMKSNTFKIYITTLNLETDQIEMITRPRPLGYLESSTYGFICGELDFNFVNSLGVMFLKRNSPDITRFCWKWQIESNGMFDIIR